MKYNFYGGPAILPREVIEEAAQAVLEFSGTGLSLLEISHRSKEFVDVMNEAIFLVKEILKMIIKKIMTRRKNHISKFPYMISISMILSS